MTSYGKTNHTKFMDWKLTFKICDLEKVASFLYLWVEVIQKLNSWIEQSLQSNLRRCHTDSDRNQVAQMSLCWLIYHLFYSTSVSLLVVGVGAALWFIYTTSHHLLKTQSVGQGREH